MDSELKNKSKTFAKRREMYFSKMKQIHFMADNVNETSEIFDINSMQCKLFLIKSFTAINSNFHYLSLVGMDSIDQQIAKAANILQLTESKSDTKQAFLSMSEMDMHKFWMRFFHLCNVQDSILHSNSVDRSKEEKFFSTFSVMNTALQYMNYDISVLNSRKVKEYNVDEEIKSWTSLKQNTVSNNNYHTAGNNLLAESQFNCDIPKLTSNINYITKKIDLNTPEINKPVYHNLEFFECFNKAVKEIETFRNNIDLISSFSCENLINNTTLLHGSKMLLNKCQIKRCNDVHRNIIILKQNLVKG